MSSVNLMNSVGESALIALQREWRPVWGAEKIAGFSDTAAQLSERYALRHYWTDAGDVNVFRVIGTKHPDYIGLLQYVRIATILFN